MRTQNTAYGPQGTVTGTHTLPLAGALNRERSLQSSVVTTVRERDVTRQGPNPIRMENVRKPQAIREGRVQDSLNGCHHVVNEPRFPGNTRAHIFY